MYKKLLLCVAIIMPYNAIMCVDRSLKSHLWNIFGPSLSAGFFTAGTILALERSFDKEVVFPLLETVVASIVITELTYRLFPISDQQIKETPTYVDSFIQPFNLSSMVAMLLGAGSATGYWHYNHS